MLVSALLAATGLALLHWHISKLRFLDVVPRSRWLSMAGGVAVAYCLVHLLPEVREYGKALHERAEGLIPFEEKLIYALMLLGLTLFYGLERAAVHSKRKAARGATSPAMFWAHMASYGAYNALLGYLLVHEDRNLRSLVLFVIGIGLHFVVND